MEGKRKDRSDGKARAKSGLRNVSERAFPANATFPPQGGANVLRAPQLFSFGQKIKIN